MRTDLLRVSDALDAIDRIERYAIRGRDAFLAEELIQIWFLYYLAVIGEALRAMSAEFQSAYPAVDWRGWTGLRNIVVHQYFRIHPERIWDAITADLPALKQELIGMRADPSDSNTGAG